jgi:hypothetical protein
MLNPLVRALKLWAGRLRRRDAWTWILRCRHSEDVNRLELDGADDEHVTDATTPVQTGEIFDNTALWRFQCWTEEEIGAHHVRVAGTLTRRHDLFGESATSGAIAAGRSLRGNVDRPLTMAPVRKNDFSSRSA